MKRDFCQCILTLERHARPSVWIRLVTQSLSIVRYRRDTCLWSVRCSHARTVHMHGLIVTIFIFVVREVHTLLRKSGSCELRGHTRVDIAHTAAVRTRIEVQGHSCSS